MDLVHWSSQQMGCRTLAKQVPWIFRAHLKCEGPRWGYTPEKKRFILREQQLKSLMNTKKVPLYLLKGHPSIHPSAFPSTFPEPSDLRFGLNRFGQQTVIFLSYEPSNLTSEKAARFPCDLHRFLDNQWVSDAGWKILAQVNVQNIDCPVCGWPGLVNTTQVLHLHRKCGNSTMPSYHGQCEGPQQSAMEDWGFF